MVLGEVQRRLATIVAIDAVGYSRQSEVDESVAVREISSLGQRVATSAATHRGRVFNTAGDGFMLEFGSVSNAMACVDELLANARVPLRAGVHIGEVSAMPGGDLLGRGVNVAARLQALAAPGEAFVSGEVKRALQGPMAERLGARGVVKLDKMDLHVETFALASEWRRAEARPFSRAALIALVARRPQAAVVAAVAALALIVAGVYGLQGVSPSMPPPPSVPPPTQRTAFFGFTTTGTEPIAVQMAEAATDETFKTMSAIGLETVSSDKTSGVARGERLTRAKELGATYALGGDVVATGVGYAISIRLDDVREQRTLWQDNTTTGSAAAKISLPVAAAAKATSVLRCFASTRASLRRADDKLLGLLTKACAKGDAVAGDTLEAIAAWRELAAHAKESAYVQGYFARRLLRVLNQQRMSASARPGVLKEARTAAQRALKLDPKDGTAPLAFLSVIDGRPRIEAERLLADGLKAAPNDGALNAYYQLFLVGSGRYRDAMFYASTAAQNDPLRPTYVPGMVLVNAGRPLEARRSFEEYTTRLADPVPWNYWIHAAIFEGLGDVRHVFDMAPANVSGDTVKCWRDIAHAAESRNRTVRRAGSNRVKECVQSRGMIPELGVSVLAALGDVDGAFALTKDEASGRNNPIGFVRAPFFTSSARPMRADPKFLPLVKERGIWDYWIDTKTGPDVCDLPTEKNFEVCVALRAAQAGK